jgi:hypothetical protein
MGVDLWLLLASSTQIWFERKNNVKHFLFLLLIYKDYFYELLDKSQILY